MYGKQGAEDDDGDRMMMVIIIIIIIIIICPPLLYTKHEATYLPTYPPTYLLLASRVQFYLNFPFQSSNKQSINVCIYLKSSHMYVCIPHHSSSSSSYIALYILLSCLSYIIIIIIIIIYCFLCFSYICGISTKWGR